MLYWLIFFFIGVVCEHHFGLYQRVQNLVMYLLGQARRLLNWARNQILRFFRWLGRILNDFLELLRRFFRWMLGLLPWWLLALLLVLVALVAGVGLGMWLLAGLFLLGLLALLLWNGLWTVLAGVVLSLIAIFAWFADLFSGLGKWLAGAFSALALSIPTCTTQPVEQSPVAPAVMEEAPVAVVPPVTNESIVVLIQPGDGTIRATARGGYPLDLNESIRWARGEGLEVQTVRGYVHAPTLYPGDSLEYKDGRWYLHRPQK